MKLLTIIILSVMAYMSGNYSCHPDNIHPASVSGIKIRVEKEQKKTMRRLIDSYSADQKRLCPAQTTDKCRWIKKRSPRYIFTWWVGETNILLLQTMAFVHLQVNIITIIIININIININIIVVISSQASCCKKLWFTGLQNSVTPVEMAS